MVQLETEDAIYHGDVVVESDGSKTANEQRGKIMKMSRILSFLLSNLY